MLDWLYHILAFLLRAVAFLAVVGLILFGLASLASKNNTAANSRTVTSQPNNYR